MTCWRRAGNVFGMPSYKEALEITSELLQRRASGAKDRDIKATDRIQEDLGLDSLAVMELASDVENRFGVSIPSEMFDPIQTVEDLARAVLKLDGSGGSVSGHEGQSFLRGSSVLGGRSFWRRAPREADEPLACRRRRRRDRRRRASLHRGFSVGGARRAGGPRRLPQRARRGAMRTMAVAAKRHDKDAGVHRARAGGGAVVARRQGNRPPRREDQEQDGRARLDRRRAGKRERAHRRGRSTRGGRERR